MSKTSPEHVTILGGGLSGLTAAYRLSKRLPNTKVTLVEASDSVGGWIKSTKNHVKYTYSGKDVEGDVILEAGPRTIRPRGSKGAAGLLHLIDNIGLRDEVITVPKSWPSAKNRYFLDYSSNPPSLQPVNLSINPLSSSALNIWKILPAFTEPFAFRPPGEDDETVDSFLKRRFGSTVAGIGQTGLHGIYAASSTDLSAQAVLGKVYQAERHYGSVIYGMFRSWLKGDAEKQEELDPGMKDAAVYGIKGGLSRLAKKLESAVRDSGVEIKLNEAITNLQPSSTDVKVITGQGSFKTDHIISCLSPHTLDSLLRSPLPTLSHNPYTSVGVVNLVFPLPSSDVHPQAFGYLVPRSGSSQNPDAVLGVIFDSTALPGMDTVDVTKLTIMMGGPYWSTYPSDSGQPSPIPAKAEDLLEPALRHIRQVFPTLRGVEPLLAIPHLNKQCIPTYLPGHYSRLKQLHGAIEGGPWGGKISLVGGGYYGIGVNDVVYSAESVVKGIVGGSRPTGLEWVLSE